jgi:hypothetical protein
VVISDQIATGVRSASAGWHALASLRLALFAAGCDGVEQVGNGDQGGGDDRCVALETWRSSS